MIGLLWADVGVGFMPKNAREGMCIWTTGCARMRERFAQLGMKILGKLAKLARMRESFVRFKSAA